MKLRPTSTEVAPKIAAIYRTPEGAVGCCLHVQLDDGNLSNAFFQEFDGNPEHVLCREVFELMKRMKKAGRLRAIEKARTLAQGSTEREWKAGERFYHRKSNSFGYVFPLGGSPRACCTVVLIQPHDGFARVLPTAELEPIGTLTSKRDIHRRKLWAIQVGLDGAIDPLTGERWPW